MNRNAIIERRRSGATLLGHKARHVLGVCARTAAAGACVFALSMTAGQAAQAGWIATLSAGVSNVGTTVSAGTINMGSIDVESGSGSISAGGGTEHGTYQGETNVNDVKISASPTLEESQAWLKDFRAKQQVERDAAEGATAGQTVDTDYLSQVTRGAAWESRKVDGKVVHNTFFNDQLEQMELNGFKNASGGMSKLQQESIDRRHEAAQGQGHKW